MKFTGNRQFQGLQMPMLLDQEYICDYKSRGGDRLTNPLLPSVMKLKNYDTGEWKVCA